VPSFAFPIPHSPIPHSPAMSAAEKASAIVLRVIDFSETSAVVTLFTREFGKISGMAKGARRPKGPFEHALDLLAQCRIVFLRKSSGALDLLTEAKLERWFRPRGHDLASLYAGYYVAELLLELTHEYDPHPELYDAAVLALVELSAGGPAAPLVLRFELAALRLLGHLPSFDVCAECGGHVPKTGRISFGLLAGGVLCERCRLGKRKLVSVSAAVVDALAQFAQGNGEAWRSLEIPSGVRGELRGVLNNYLAHLFGRRPRMHEYLDWK
jgi:DNA repair protein RecO (recombination protein O)